MSEGHTRVEIRLSAPLDPLKTELVTTGLFELGCAGLEEKDEGETYVIVAGFSADDAPAATELEFLLEQVDVQGTVTFGTFESVDWSTHWRRHMKSMQFGDLWIVPSWLETPEDAAHSLVIDPSMAFGTGQHETTALCLERIGELSPVKAVLDIGTGTGILAMAALRLGAKRAVGTDNDPEALRVALENAEANDLVEDLQLTDAAPNKLGTFPLVIANILAGPLADMAPAIASAVASGGHLMLSGILHDQADDVRNAYEAQGLRCEDVVRKNEWVRIDLVRDS